MISGVAGLCNGGGGGEGEKREEEEKREGETQAEMYRMGGLLRKTKEEAQKHTQKTVTFAEGLTEVMGLTKWRVKGGGMENCAP